MKTTPENHTFLPVGVERLVVLPKLRFRICFDLDLNSLLSKFKSNPTLAKAIKIGCTVEKLHG